MKKTRAKKAVMVEVAGEKKTRKHKPTRELLVNGMCAGDVCTL